MLAPLLLGRCGGQSHQGQRPWGMTREQLPAFVPAAGCRHPDTRSKLMASVRPGSPVAAETRACARMSLSCPEQDEPVTRAQGGLHQQEELFPSLTSTRGSN